LKLLFIPAWFPNDDDVQNGIFNHLHAQAFSRKMDVSVFFFYTSATKGNLFEISRTKDAAIEVFKIKFPTAIFRLFKLLYILKFLHREIKKQQPDVICFSVIEKNHWLALYCHYVFKIPLVVIEHWSGYTKIPFPKSKWQTWCIKKVMQLATNKFCVSSFLKGKIEALFHQTFQILPNVIEGDPNTVKRNNTSFSKFLVVADLDDEVKNISGIIRAFQCVSSQFQASTLTIIGEGKDENKLKKLVIDCGLKEKVIFLKRQEKKTMSNIYFEHDVLVLNSNVETFGMVAYEAILHGLPVILPDLPVFNTFFNDQNAVIFEKSNAQALANAMMNMALTTYTFHLDKSSEYVKSNFDAESIGQYFYNTLQATL
jgi:glycosyltransferase involved in cell wall biosynthesis